MNGEVTISGGEVTARGRSNGIGDSVGKITISPQDGQKITVTTGDDENGNTIKYFDETKITTGSYFHSVAEGVAGNELYIYVCGVELSGSSSAPVYATTDEYGKVTKCSSTDEWNVKWDGKTLTLRNVDMYLNITDESYFLYNLNYLPAAVLCQGVNADIELELIGENTIIASYYAVSADSVTISGSGLLRAWNYSYSDYAFNCNVTVRSGTVEASGSSGPVSGTLTVDPAEGARLQVSTHSGLVDRNWEATAEAAKVLAVYYSSSVVTLPSGADYLRITDKPDSADGPDGPLYSGGEKYYELSFVTSGGSELEVLRVDPGKTVDLGGYISRRAGYDFAGWFADETCAERLYEIKMDGDKRVYAAWEPFADAAPGDWFYDYVVYVYANGLMDGTDTAAFSPNAGMTRAMLWAILARIDGETVTGDSWAEDARAWAMAEGVSDGEDANGLVTREQFVTMLWRFAGEPASSYSLSGFTDSGSVSDWAGTAMRWAVANGIITGVTDTTIEPAGSTTRAQAAAMLMRFVEG